MCGYQHPGYAESLSEFGTPRQLANCGGWILVRQIPGHAELDGMGCYPLFCCHEWSKLPDDLEMIDDLVCLSLVTDPFGAYRETDLRRWFSDIVLPFKEHYVIDLQKHGLRLSRHHRHYAKKALNQMTVEVSTQPDRYLDEWIALYHGLILRHQLHGIKAFSSSSFAKQFRVPGLVLFRAIEEEITIGSQLWFVQDEIAYGHLGAYSPRGYELSASYGLVWRVIEYFHGKVRWLDLGGSPGIRQGIQQGLSDFKRGWSTGTRTAYFCGRIFNPDRYACFARQQPTKSGYFPIYREGEF